MLSEAIGVLNDLYDTSDIARGLHIRIDKLGCYYRGVSPAKIRFKKNEYARTADSLNALIIHSRRKFGKSSDVGFNLAWLKSLVEEIDASISHPKSALSKQLEPTAGSSAGFARKTERPKDQMQPQDSRKQSSKNFSQSQQLSEQQVTVPITEAIGSHLAQHDKSKHQQTMDESADATSLKRADQKASEDGGFHSQTNSAPAAIASPPPVVPLFRPPAKRGEWQIIPPQVPWYPEGIEDAVKELLQDGWKEETDWADHYAKSSPGLDGWRFVAATRRGRMHEHKGTHREDAFALDTGSWFSTACVCDGAGSCKYSRVGAKVTATLMARSIREQLTPKQSEMEQMDPETVWGHVKGSIVSAALDTQQKLVDLAVKGKFDSTYLRCTMLVVVHYKCRNYSGFVISQIGDGFIASRRLDRHAARHGESDSGEYSGQVNCFMPDAPAWQKAEASIMKFSDDGVDAILLCSDGVEDPFFPIPDTIDTLFNQLYDGVTAALPDFVRQNPHGSIVHASDEVARKNLREWLAYEKRGENDDRTIVILHRTSNPPASSVSTQQPPQEANPAQDGANDGFSVNATYP